MEQMNPKKALEVLFRVVGEIPLKRADHDVVNQAFQSLSDVLNNPVHGIKEAGDGQ